MKRKITETPFETWPSPKLKRPKNGEMNPAAQPTPTDRLIERYTHQPLSLELKQIRLLSFRPLDESAPDRIACTLEIYEHSSAPEYVALSYTWGEPVPVFPIYIDNGYLDIGRNLHSFCLAFCRSKEAKFRCESVYLWIDQVCIDQDNTLEKNHQVGIMHDIYAQATSVLTWLNDDAMVDDQQRP